MVIGSWGVSKSLYSEFRGPTAVQSGAGEAEKNGGERKSKTERSPSEPVEPAKPY